MTGYEIQSLPKYGKSGAKRTNVCFCGVGSWQEGKMSSDSFGLVLTVVWSSRGKLPKTKQKLEEPKGYGEGYIYGSRHGINCLRY